MRTISFFIFAIGFGFATPALASCASPNDPGTPAVNIVEHWTAKHVEYGKLPGCLLKFKTKDGSEELAYTAYKFVCQLPKEESLSVQMLFSCCDTGLQGDFVCGVTTFNPFKWFQQTNVTIIPAKPDVRGIPDLMENLDQADMFRTTGIAARLWDYAQVPELKSHVYALLPQLNTLMANSDHAHKKSAIASLILKLRQQDGHTEEDLDIAVTVLKGDFFEWGPNQQVALDIIVKQPEEGQKSIPVLVDLLRRSPMDQTTEDRILQALPLFGTAVQPNILLIRRSLDNDQKWSKIVCAAYPVPEGVDSHRIYFESYEKITPIDC